MRNTTDFDLEALPPARTLSAQAAQSLRDAIIKGTIPAGKVLRLDDLASRFGISRIPLRDSLRQLEKEGFVNITPYRGAKVLPLTLEEGIELCDISEVLHCSALRPAFPRMTMESLDRADELFRRRRLVDDTAEWRRLSDEFLKTFYGPGNRPLTIEMIKLVTDQALRYWYACLPYRKTDTTPRASFIDVVEACRRRNLDDALQLIAEAHRGSKETITEVLKSREIEPAD
jgi:DNA-binding GntR family transcriptional regulator